MIPRVADIRSRLFDLSAEQLIDYSRCALAAVAFLAFLLIPHPVDADVSLAHVVLFWYLGYAVAITVIAKFWSAEPVWPLATHLIDISASVLLMRLTDGSISPFFTLFTFALIAATLRWDWRGAVWTTLALLLLFIGLTVAEGLDKGELPRIVLRGTYVLFLGLVLTYFGARRAYNRERFAKLATWPAREVAVGSNPPVGALLGHAADVMGAARILVIWEESQEPGRHFSLWSEGRLECLVESTSEPIEQLIAPALADAVFMTRSARSSLITTHGGMKHCVAPAIADQLRTRYNIATAVSAPFARERCRGRIFALDCTRLVESHLPLVEIVADRVCLEIEHYFLQLQIQDTAAERERTRLAHDLHDGILQSLTAAALGLKTYCRNPEKHTRDDLDVIRHLLAVEQRRIRAFVDESRLRTSREILPLAKKCERLLAQLSASWHCEIPLRISPMDASIPPAVAEHVWLILAEAIANAAKHGHASCVCVDLERTMQALAICVRDNGSGFPALSGTYADDKLTAMGRGPLSLINRVRGSGGAIVLSTSPAGSELLIRLPIQLQ
jgi:signal transduction histidine kinase